MAQRKIPMRKDIVTGEMKPKKELVRVVKKAEKAKKDRTFDKAFGLKIDDAFYDELVAYVDHQAARAELFGNGK